MDLLRQWSNQFSKMEIYCDIQCHKPIHLMFLAEYKRNFLQLFQRLRAHSHHGQLPTAVAKIFQGLSPTTIQILSTRIMRCPQQLIRYKEPSLEISYKKLSTTSSAETWKTLGSLPKSPIGVKSCVSSLGGYSPKIWVSICISSCRNSKVSGQPKYASTCILNVELCYLIRPNFQQYHYHPWVRLSRVLLLQYSFKLFAPRSQKGLGISLMSLFMSDSESLLGNRSLLRSLLPTSKWTRSG